jgi:predicted 3-demethylubiquinone-9 3-methyltransferase (glyoxalase superfamily)
LRDRFGVSWQIVPRVLHELLRGGGDEARAERVMAAMLKMDKLEIKPLEVAYNAST